jgi:hypothetical protein
MAKRERRVGSVAAELPKKARKAMLSAVQFFHNPQLDFKAELSIVTAAEKPACSQKCYPTRLTNC